MLRLLVVSVLYVLHGCPDVDAERAPQPSAVVEEAQPARHVIALEAVTLHAAPR